jgi:hypothetical protein
MLKTITLTGADERTPIQDLVNLVADDPRVEIGLLYTANPEGRNRYPSLRWLEYATSVLGERCAVHICGGTARKQFLAFELTKLLGPVGRVQVNGNMTIGEVQAATIAVDHPGRQQVITQHQANNAFLAPMLISDNHALLVDGSGGRGIRPDQWLRPETSKPVGFAGGLGPENLAAELPKIASIATGESWVDMEGRLRRSDWFDIGLARECAAVFRGFCEPLARATNARRMRP